MSDKIKALNEFLDEQDYDRMIAFMDEETKDVIKEIYILIKSAKHTEALIYLVDKVLLKRGIKL
jgi:hypothetical protein